jgi:hypothetical protein
VKRREFILGSMATVWPVVARAQQSTQARRVGALMPHSDGDPEGQARFEAFREASRSSAGEPAKIFRSIFVGMFPAKSELELQRQNY